MHVLIAAIGKAKSSPEISLYSDYIRRLKWKVELKEFDVKIADTKKRKMEEAKLLLAACDGHERVVALDETGQNISSQALAGELKKWQGQGYSSVAFIIGGADGLDENVRQKAHLVLSFGRATWPHMLVRAMLAEQLYRAWSLLNNHPYHRA